jgi:hypothetical protein
MVRPPVSLVTIDLLINYAPPAPPFCSLPHHAPYNIVPRFRVPKLVAAVLK